jgi:hypothetical protein
MTRGLGRAIKIANLLPLEREKRKERQVYLQDLIQLSVSAKVNIRRQHTTGTQAPACRNLVSGFGANLISRQIYWLSGRS